MKTLLATLIALLAVAGCKVDVPDASVKQGPAAAQNDKATPAAPEAKAPPTKVAEAPSSQKKAPDNPKRIYQLADLAHGTVKIGAHSVPVWLMDTDSKREEGLMWVTDKEMKDDEGMLFSFPTVQDHARAGFWMQNTVLPLDIIYISPKFEIVSIAEGKPFDETQLPAAADYQFVVEMKQGSAKRLGFKAGTKVDIPADLQKAE